MTYTRRLKHISLVLVLALFFSFAPFSAFAEEEQPVNVDSAPEEAGDNSDTEIFVEETAFPQQKLYGSGSEDRYQEIFSGEGMEYLSNNQTCMTEVDTSNAAGITFESETCLICGYDADTGLWVYYDYSCNEAVYVYLEELIALIDDVDETYGRFFFKESTVGNVRIVRPGIGLVLVGDSLITALNSSRDSDIIRLDNDINECGIPVNSGVTIDFNGHTIDGTNTGSSSPLFIINTQNAVTFTDSSISGGGAIKNGPAGGIEVYSGSTLSLENIAVSGCEGYSGAAVKNSGTLNAFSCIFDNNIATDSGGAIYNTAGKSMNLTSCRVTDNSSSFGQGGGICNYGSLVLSGQTVISGNEAEMSYGGGIYSNGSLKFTGNTVISGNTSVMSSGGGICIESGTVVFNGEMEISGNTAEYGGGIFCANNTGLVLNKVNIHDNNARFWGSLASTQEHPIVSLTPTAASGGGVYCTDTSSLTVTDSVITGNTSSGYGPGIYSEAPAAVYGSVIIKNNSGKNGSTGIAVKGTEKIGVSGDLTGSDIHFTMLTTGSSADRELPGIVTKGYIENNPGAALTDYFHSDSMIYAAVWDESGKEIKLVDGDCLLTLSSRAGETDSVAVLSGGGMYLSGTSVTVKAQPNEGFRFVGWYDENTKVSSEPDYTFTITGNTTLVAECAAVGSFTLTVAGEYAAGVTVTGTGLAAAEGQQYVWISPSGAVSDVSLSYTENTGETFLYWADENGNKLYGGNPYSFALVKNMTIVPVVSSEESASGTLNIKFLSKTGGLISISTVKTENGLVTKQVVIPVAPSLLGYSFTGWTVDSTLYDTDADLIDAIDTYALSHTESGASLDVSATYDSDGDKYYITVKFDGTAEEKADQRLGPYNVGESTLVRLSDNEDENPFLYWTDSSGKILSYARTCTVRPHGDITVTAVFGETETAVLPVVSVTDMYTFTDKGVTKIRTTVSYNVPEDSGYTFVAAGVLYSTDSNAVFDIDGTAKQYTSILNSYYGNVTVNYRYDPNQSGTFTAAGFVTVTKNGQTLTYISDTRNVSFG